MPNWNWQRNPNKDEDQRASKVGSPQNEPIDLEIEKKWLQRARVEPAEFGYFYRKYYDTIFKFIVGDVQNVDVAQEMTNEVFSIALDRLEKFRWQGFSFGAWLFRIAHNLKCQEGRRKKQSPEVPWNEEQNDIADPLRADFNLEQSELNEILADCINNLHPVRRQIVRAHYWSGLKVREIAMVMDQTESNVKNHLRRGRSQLQRDLMKRGLERGLPADKMSEIKEMIVKDEGWTLLGNEDSGVSE